jgi:hypothetical protein
MLESPEMIMGSRIRNGLCVMLAGLTAAASLFIGSRSVFADEPREVRCLLIEVYSDQGDSARSELLRAVDDLQAQRRGITVARRDLRDPAIRQRLDTILRHFRLPEGKSPAVYGCNRIVHTASAANSWSQQIEQLITMEVYVRQGCSRCQAAKEWLKGFQQRFPGLQLVYRDLVTEPQNQQRLTDLVARHRTSAASVPVFHMCNQVLVGFDRPETSGLRVENALKKWTHACPDRKLNAPARRPNQPTSLRSLIQPNGSVSFGIALQSGLIRNALPLLTTWPHVLQQDDSTNKDSDTQLPLPSPADDPNPLPLDDLPLPADSAIGTSQEPPADAEVIDLPLFGRLNVRRLGLPLFTIAVGLVDGFNPCAMWVLLFLLSILVNLKDRLRILAIAGTFVVISGAAYFAFMAAWLNVFVLIGYLRPIQVGLGLMALGVGSVHIKDFFAFQQGFSLSIPESAKPGIYSRVRRIVTAEHMTAAITGAAVLAVLVNVVELLCTAGLPALYTNILMQQGLTTAGRYGYLLLYVLAYMFDDSLMIAVVVTTLSRTKLQETQGRWLKLLSGLVIAILGVIMIFKPEWLG